MENLYRYVGIGPSGGSYTGARELTPRQMANWVEMLYTAGWEQLTVTLDGREVGRIGPSGGPWWAEGSD